MLSRRNKQLSQEKLERKKVGVRLKQESQKSELSIAKALNRWLICENDTSQHKGKKGTLRHERYE
jgi:hypothetical protein